MNLFQKLAKARVQLQSKELKKSGKNKFANFTYFELKDFLPEVNAIFDELGLCGAISFSKEFATLRIFNAEKPEEMIEFNSPMVAQGLTKGSTEIQNLGAVQTYQRRYLYMNALEISENDWVDAQDNSKQTNQPQEPVNNPETLFNAFMKNAEQAQSLNQLKTDFGTVYKLLTPELQEKAKEFYDVRKKEFEQENE